ncbi:HPP family protein [Geotalea sp. SG265]|uniref:HPP family protein n=1 Tax=Geotalea sp. SG265 TaxID=2922867 RepID=UPI001FAEDFD9|nr:HPP family protein [Geotalea sp. SG265]
MATTVRGKPKSPLTAIGEGVKVGCLLSVPALIAWITGRPFIFPSLGPSAFALVMDRQGEITARHVLGGHLIGAICGFLSFNALAHGFTASHFPDALSLSLLRLAASGIVSVVLTTVLMVTGRMQHAPACATTMIVSLGLLSTLVDAIFIMTAILIMYGVHRLFIATGLQQGKKQP